MKLKKSLLLVLMLALIVPAKAADVENVKPVKNVILLIPDGTSLATVSIARWLQWYQDPAKRTCSLIPIFAEPCVRIPRTRRLAIPLRQPLVI